MRFLSALKNDIHFQFQYGFYFLYVFFSAFYILLLQIIPSDYKSVVASIIILSDPAMLGVFFIGGVWLLEKGEGLHNYWGISPLRCIEYVLSKVISLAFLSMIASVGIILLGMRDVSNLLFLSIWVFLGSLVFNLIGLIIASYAHSINHYMMIIILPAILLGLPPILTIFGITNSFLDLFPGTSLWYLLLHAIDTSNPFSYWMVVNLILWFVIFLYCANKRIQVALQNEGGK